MRISCCEIGDVVVLLQNLKTLNNTKYNKHNTSLDNNTDLYKKIIASFSLTQSDIAEVLYKYFTVIILTTVVLLLPLETTISTLDDTSVVHILLQNVLPQQVHFVSYANNNTIIQGEKRGIIITRKP